MKQILVLTDFSEAAVNAQAFAHHFFTEEAHFHYLYLSKNTEEKINLNNHINENETVQVIENKYSVLENIKRYVQEHQPDFIVMGTGNRIEKESKNSDLTYQVLTKIKCKTIVIPWAVGFSNIDSVIFPTDYLNFGQVNIIEPIQDIIEKTSAQIKFLRIDNSHNGTTEEQQINRNYLKGSLSKKSISLHKINSDELEINFNKFIEQNPKCLITIAAKSLHFINQLFFFPQHENLPYRSKTPLLILH